MKEHIRNAFVAGSLLVAGTAADLATNVHGLSLLPEQTERSQTVDKPTAGDVSNKIKDSSGRVNSVIKASENPSKD